MKTNKNIVNEAERYLVAKALLSLRNIKKRNNTKFVSNRIYFVIIGHFCDIYECRYDTRNDKLLSVGDIVL